MQVYEPGGVEMVLWLVILGQDARVLKSWPLWSPALGLLCQPRWLPGHR